jgi:hypothetical protein
MLQDRQPDVVAAEPIEAGALVDKGGEEVVEKAEEYKVQDKRLPK